MAVLRLWLVIGLLWLLQFLFLPLLPLLRVVLDPLFLILVFIGLHAPSGRFLWAAGFGLGLAKDLIGGGLFGASACSFALIGWILEVLQNYVEKEDPILQGFWAGALSLIQWFFYGLIVQSTGSYAGWNPRIFFYLPPVVLFSALCAFFGFSPLRRFLKIRRGERIHLYVSDR